MRIVLTSIDKPLAEAWREYCDGMQDVEVFEGSIFDCGCKAVVSPANSSGYMDGGIDWTYSQHFGWHVQERLQEKIRTEYDGELLIGQAILMETKNLVIPYLIAAPTMRVPQKLDEKTVNPFLAARAALRVAKRHGIESVAFPGLGTGVGELSPSRCAIQVREAIDHVLFGEPPFPVNWQDALERHTFLYTGLRTTFEEPTSTNIDEIFDGSLVEIKKTSRRVQI
jgi:O-acetyl-ADP-ribose deacetylase (regulator of RNase III)